MKVEYINPFSVAAHSVLTTVLEDNEIKRGQLAVSNDPHVIQGVSTVVGVSGALMGHVIFDMTKKTALAVASTMNGEPMVGLDNITRSTINELANMVAGNAAAKLSEAGYVCDITPPTFIIGEKSEVYAHKGMKHLVVPFETKCGQITISVALSEN
jgi:chemotaxis protein CheX